ncbi:Smr protein/MutS2 C-terminal [Macleaya cordata]|uniref:Smr protein/MutS2 C-terminal n=1 Tax=Macleaya cordata TaxID=56857 RepID=A0A200RBQ9_MACCD|nr:Smr protein/MutS2 C-terminal [Macleaya cordata]
MAFHLSSSHSHICHDHHHHPLSNSLCSSRIVQFTPSLFSWPPKIFNHPPKLNSLSAQPRFSLSLQDPVPQKSLYPDEETTSSTKNYIWVNPKSPRASEFRQQSYDARYSFLTKIAQSLDSSNPTEIDVSMVLSSLGDKPLEQDAVIVLNNMKNPETALLALKYFLQKLKSKRDVILYNVTLKVYRKSRNLDGAEMLFGEMLERGVKPDNITFSTIISCARLCSLPDKALEWFEKMPQFGCEPDDVIQSAMIDVYGRLGNIDMTLSLYDQARREKWRIDVVTFSTLIKIYSTLGDFHKAFNVYEEMKVLGMKPNLTVYNTVLDAMGKAKRPWQVKTVAKEMMKNGIAPNWPTYAALLRAYGKARYAEDALDVYREMKGKGLELNVVLYNTLLAMCADIGYTDQAIEIFEDLKRSETCQPDSWTYSSLITIYSCSGNVSEAERMLNEMLEAGFEPNIFVLTSLIQCYGKANQIDDVLRTFDRLLELGITPDDRFCGCLLNVMNQTPKEELGKLVRCIEKANPKLGYVVKQLIEKEGDDSVFKQEATELIDTISTDVRKAYCNCLIDLCVNLNRLDKACELLELGLTLEIYTAIQSKSPTQWSLNLKSLSLGAALTALHIWMSDLSKALDNGEELPPLLGINTGHGKHNADKGLASVFAAHLRELNAPFHEAPDKGGWFFTTKIAAVSWLELRKSPESIAA